MLVENLYAQLKELLKQHVIFSILSDEESEQLAEKVELATFAMGEAIITEGEPGDCAYLIYSGRVRVFRELKGKPLTLGTCSNGDLFGETALLHDETRNASVRAADDVVLLRISRDSFSELLDGRPELRGYLERLMQDHAVVNFLRLATFLGQLPARQITVLLDQLKPCSFGKDETVFRQGQPADRLYIIRSGEVKVVSEENGRQRLLNHLGEGDYFGERALILEEPRLASVIATQPTECFSLSRENFHELLKMAPQIKEQLQRRIEQYHIDAELEQKFGARPPARVERQRLTYRTSEEGVVEPTEAEPAAPAVRQKLRGRRGLFRKYPWIRQQEETDCGAACLAMISRYYGIRLSVGRLREVANVGREGASMYNLANGAEQIGYVTRAIRTDDAHLEGLELPAIAHWKGYHYVVLYEVRGDRVIVGDPGIGLLKMSREEFNEGWTGRLLSLSPTSRLEENAPAKTTLGRYLPFFAPYRFLLFEVLIASVILEVLQLA